jgi:AcrR family transcriptional regulator
MSPRRGQARENILQCAAQLVHELGAPAVTVEAVASAAGTAKGLVHYHFKTKAGLLEAVASQLGTERCARWKGAFDAGNTVDVIQNTWNVLTEESASGAIRAWASMLGASSPLSDRSVKALMDDFSRALAAACDGMFQRLGLAAVVQSDELGWLLSGVIDGLGLRLAAGAHAADIEAAYTAAWLGILAVAEQRI